MEHKGSKWVGKTSQFKKRKKHRKDKEMIFDNSVIAEEESDYVIQDEKGNILLWWLNIDFYYRIFSSNMIYWMYGKN